MNRAGHEGTVRVVAVNSRRLHLMAVVGGNGDLVVVVAHDSSSTTGRCVVPSRSSFLGFLSLYDGITSPRPLHRLLTPFFRRDATV